MRFRAGVALLTWMALFFPMAASAHVYKADGTIRALLHLNPEDNPVAGRTSGLWFYITDSSGQFTNGACDCRISITDGSQTLVDRPLTAAEATSERVIQVNYKFPYQADYAVVLQGVPRQAGAFQAFRLPYDVRVDRGTLKSPLSPLLTWALVASGGLGVIAAGYFILRELRQDSGGK